MAGTDLLQQVDELVSGQPLEHGEVRQLWGVRPKGKSHGRSHLGGRVGAGGSPSALRRRQQQGSSPSGLGTGFERAPEGALASQLHFRDEWPPPAGQPQAPGTLASGLHQSPNPAACSTPLVGRTLVYTRLEDGEPRIPCLLQREKRLPRSPGSRVCATSVWRARRGRRPRRDI